MVYDRTKSWNKSRVNTKEVNFRSGYDYVMGMWEWKEAYPGKFNNKDIRAGMEAGIQKRKEEEMITLLEGPKIKKGKIFVGASHQLPPFNYTHFDTKD